MNTNAPEIIEAGIHLTLLIYCRCLFEEMLVLCRSSICSNKFGSSFILGAGNRTTRKLSLSLLLCYDVTKLIYCYIMMLPS